MRGARFIALLGAISVNAPQAWSADPAPAAGSDKAMIPATQLDAVPAAIPVPRPVRHADFGKLEPSRDARHVADWVVDSDDSKALPFLIVDKVAAKVFAFDAHGRLRGVAPALLGIALGDDSAPGVGDRELSSIPVKDRTTPAGRFLSGLGHNYAGKDILWVDYDAAISMHRVINTNPRERRPHRLTTPTTADKRISFGCINVPIRFFEDVVRPAFGGPGGFVYVLPETRSVRSQFSSYDVRDAAERARALR
ncbi:MAG: hypothetical protein ABI630_01935 [Betaproteobacteria bacterium]